MNRQELKYILYCAIFAAVYFFLALPFLIKIIDGNILGQFLIFDLGLIILLNIYFKSRSTGTKINVVKSLEYMLVILAAAIYLPPYHIVPWSGEIQDGAVLGTASVDYFFGAMGQQYLHLSGIFISIWTFLIVPIILFYLASQLSKSSFVSNI
jgi:hypothetical protein